jgi:hypothetical protein
MIENYRLARLKRNIHAQAEKLSFLTGIVRIRP